MSLEGKRTIWLTERAHVLFRQLPKISLARLLNWSVVMAAAGVALLTVIREGPRLLLEFRQLDVFGLTLAFLVACTGLLLAVPLWRRILSRYGVHQSARDDLRIYCYSALGIALPGGFWPIVSRASLYHRLGVSRLVVTTASVMESLTIGIASMLVYFLIVVGQPRLSLWERPEIGLAFSLLVLLLIHPRLFNRLSRWMFQWARYSEEPVQVDVRAIEVMAWLAVEIVEVLTGGLALYILVGSLVPLPNELLVPMIAVWAVSAAVGNLFFWLPGTFVFRDGALLVVLLPYVSAPVAILVALFARVWMIFAHLLIAGLIWLFLDRPHQGFKV